MRVFVWMLFLLVLFFVPLRAVEYEMLLPEVTETENIKSIALAADGPIILTQQYLCRLVLASAKLECQKREGVDYVKSVSNSPGPSVFLAHWKMGSAGDCSFLDIRSFDRPSWGSVQIKELCLKDMQSVGFSMFVQNEKLYASVFEAKKYHVYEIKNGQTIKRFTRQGKNAGANIFRMLAVWGDKETGAFYEYDPADGYIRQIDLATGKIIGKYSYSSFYESDSKSGIHVHRNNVGANPGQYSILDHRGKEICKYQNYDARFGFSPVKIDGGKFIAAIRKQGGLFLIDPCQRRETVLKNDLLSPIETALAIEIDANNDLALIVHPDGRISFFSMKSKKYAADLFIFKDGGYSMITQYGFFSNSPSSTRRISFFAGDDIINFDQLYDTLYRPGLVVQALRGDPSGKLAIAAKKLNLQLILETGLPPLIKLHAPLSGPTIQDASVVIDAFLEDHGGGIGRIEWRVNGVTRGGGRRGARKIKSAVQGGGVRISEKLPLDPGENIIELVVYNEKNLIASEPARIKVKWNGVAIKGKPRLYVLSVGVNKYLQGSLQLKYAVSDARSLGDAFKKAGKSLYEKVEVTTVLDGRVNETGLEKVFAALSKKIRTQDVFVFFLAGHGKTIDGRYYFLPQDILYKGRQSVVQKGIGQDRWQAWLRQIKARKSVLIYDTCESGSMTLAMRSTSQIDEREVAIRKLSRSMGRTIIAASTDTTPALEGFRGHGLFTYVILEAFGAADLNHSKNLELTELIGYIDEKVPDYSKSAFKFVQVPQINMSGSNFALVSAIHVLEGAEPVYPNTHTHVVITKTLLRSLPSQIAENGTGTGIGIGIGIGIEPGTRVYLVKTMDGWSLIARDGKKLGWVRVTALLKMQ